MLLISTGRRGMLLNLLLKDDILKMKEQMNKRERDFAL